MTYALIAFLHHLGAFAVLAAIVAVPAIRRTLHLELIGVAVILLAAALMAKGIG
ncbi:MAG TPA: hypothetical protein VFR66_10340 [Burkholderiales bacterium]|nr:hypothetical protein [Burkholderiales bacterium]